MPISSTTNKGIIQTATNAVADAGVNSTDALVSTNLATAIPLNTADASETVKGIVELATDGETITGTSQTLATHPLGVAAAILGALPEIQSNAEGFYILQANGVIEQWGTEPAVGTSTRTIDLPIEMDSAVYNIQITNVSTNSTAPQALTRSETSFTMKMGSGTANVDWKIKGNAL